jgi:hypothetical protein
LRASPQYRESDFPEPCVEVWEEHWDVINLYVTYSTQWRVGMNGVVALDMNVFHHALDRKGVVGEEFDDFIDDLRTIERAALLHLSK